jgi:hypothetical protein
MGRSRVYCTRPVNANQHNVKTTRPIPWTPSAEPVAQPTLAPAPRIPHRAAGRPGSAVTWAGNACGGPDAVGMKPRAPEARG